MFAVAVLWKFGLNSEIVFWEISIPSDGLITWKYAWLALTSRLKLSWILPIVLDIILAEYHRSSVQSGWKGMHHGHCHGAAPSPLCPARWLPSFRAYAVLYFCPWGSSWLSCSSREAGRTVSTKSYRSRCRASAAGSSRRKRPRSLEKKLFFLLSLKSNFWISMFWAILLVFDFENYQYIPSQSVVKAKPIVIGSRAISRAQRRRHLYALRYDWLTWLLESSWIDQD